MNYAIGKRGCGFRAAGGVYMECGLAPNGKPVEWFLYDPPLEMGNIELSAQGIQLIQDSAGVYHVVDWIGESNYPRVADFIEEVREMGVSRRASATTHFELLGPGSTMIFVHRHAIYNDPATVIEQNEAMPPFAGSDAVALSRCALFAKAKDSKHFHDSSISCSRLWYFQTPDDIVRRDPQSIYLRDIPGVVRYQVTPLSPAADAEYATRPGLFMRVPISRLAVVEAQDGSHLDTQDRIAKMTALRVDVTQA